VGIIHPAAATTAATTMRPTALGPATTLTILVVHRFISLVFSKSRIRLVAHRIAWFKYPRAIRSASRSDPNPVSVEEAMTLPALSAPG
jgi:hypothetical protein